MQSLCLKSYAICCMFTQIQCALRFMNTIICVTLISMLKQIAIDGPVASGKTTVGRRVSHALSWKFLDTGLMYRAATWLILKKMIRLDQPNEMSATIGQAKMELKNQGDADVLLVDGIDITRELRTQRIEETVSRVSKVAGVRRALVEQQRTIARQGPIVMVGRDIGTVVLQSAPVKVYLEASPEVRAFRRYTENLSNKENSTLEAVGLEIGNRDQIDSGRKESPLHPAKDAIVINFYYEEGDVGQFMPTLEAISIENLHVVEAKRAFMMRGYPHTPITGVSLKNITIEKAEKDSVIENVAEVTQENIVINGKAVVI